MKKVVMTIAMTLLVGGVTSWAQSSGQSQTGSRASSAVSKDTNSQFMGKGVPYNKEKEQFGKHITKKKTGSLPVSSVSTGPGVSDAALKGKTPGSHVAHREVKLDGKTSPKTGTNSSKKKNQ